MTTPGLPIQDTELQWMQLYVHKYLPKGIAKVSFIIIITMLAHHTTS